MRKAIATYPTNGAAEVFGVQDVVAIANPAPGSDWTFTIPAGYYRRFLCGYALFTTSAVVANRFTASRVTDGNRRIWFQRETAAMTASVAFDFSLTTAASTYGTQVAAAVGNLTFPYVWMPPGFVMSVLTTGIDAGDQWSSIALWFECWDYGPQGQRENVHRPTLAELEATVELPERVARVPAQPTRLGGR